MLTRAAAPAEAIIVGVQNATRGATCVELVCAAVVICVGVAAEVEEGAGLDVLGLRLRNSGGKGSEGESEDELKTR